jgi:beta-glucuronidase
MKGALIALLLLAGPAFAAPVPSNLIANVPGRTTISLDGEWRVIVDPYETGIGGRFYENAKPKDKHELREYDFDASPALNVPGDWNSQRTDLFFYEGPVWYKKSFSYRKREHGRVFVYFGAANYKAAVYLNGKKIGDHQGGFTPFNFEVTDKIQDGENFIVVEVNNQRFKDAVPSSNTDFWNYGGLTRDVSLVEVPETFIQDYFVQLTKGSMNEISGWVQLNGAPQQNQLTFEIPEAGIKKVISINGEGRGEFRFVATVELWSPEKPKLYKVSLSAGGDLLTDQIGFRSIETRGSSLILNGKPIMLRGVSMHEEAPFRGGRAFSPEDDQVLLGWAKELHCNFVRLAHYPHNESMTRLADRLGLLVWSEIPVYWETAWENPSTLQIAEEQLRDMIARDHNRAAVILWSVANETPVDPARLTFLKVLVDDARRLDSTRLITAAMNHFETPAPGTKTLADPLAQFLDVIGINEYMAWYGKETFEDIDRTKWSIPYDKPLIVSEFGGEAPFGNHGDGDARWTEEYQANLFDHQINMLKRIPSFAGMSPWVLMDFHSPRRLLPGIQDYLNRKGLVSDRGQRKKAFFVLQEFYRQMIETSTGPNAAK